MKFRRIALLLTLTLGLYGLPTALAQDAPDKTTPPATSPEAQSSPSSTPDGSGPQPVQQPEDAKVKHDGGKSDVDAIGNRKIGGRGMGNWYSVEGEIRMGKEYAQQVEASVKLVASIFMGKSSSNHIQPTPPRRISSMVAWPIP